MQRFALMRLSLYTGDTGRHLDATALKDGLRTMGICLSLETVRRGLRGVVKVSPDPVRDCMGSEVQRLHRLVPPCAPYASCELGIGQGLQVMLGRSFFTLTHSGLLRGAG